MDFFDKLGKKASEAYKVTADKTGKIAKETKLKFKIGEYEKHVREEDISIQKELEEQCTKIDVLSDEIDSLLKECLALKDKKQCIHCYKEIEKEDKFCPNCGKKQTEEPAQEVEILEKLENTQVEEKKTNEKQKVKEKLEQEVKKKAPRKKKQQEESQEEKTNLEKTVEIESNVKLEEENKK